MAKWKLNEQGQVIGEDGEPLKVGEDVLTLTEIEGAKTQRDIDAAIEPRVARLNKQIEALKAQAERTPELDKMISDLNAEKAQLEAQVAEVKESAKEEARAQLEKVKAEREKLKADLDNERAARVQDQVSTIILGNAKDRFNDPAIDVVPHLLRAHKREPKKGPDGKDTGEFVDLFKVRVQKDEDSEPVDEWHPVDKALEAWAAAHPHHVRPNGNGGSGGGSYGGSFQNLKRSGMSAQQKSEFIANQGLEKFKELPA